MAETNITGPLWGYEQRSRRLAGLWPTSFYVAPISTQRAIFGYGAAVNNVYVNVTNLVSNTGAVASDTTGVGTPRDGLAAAGYSLT